ncbi:MAG: DUF1611 domain-containing protein [Candidatus Eremiobacteraeota bacterium]|nr:DUF1611 domain-containing protein [Candidatus Eremiobacteraeota bacterium]
MRKYLILAPDEFAGNAKTAHGVIRYSADTTVAVIDSSLAGKTVREVLPHLNCDAPIVADVRSGLHYGPTALLIGTAPQGGALPESWRAAVLEAIAAGLEIVSGLHDLLNDDPQFAAAAKKHGVSIWDVRIPPIVPLFSGAAFNVNSTVLLTVGSNCNVGKMTVSLELVRAANAAGRSATFVPTGQTGIMIAGWGIAIDRVIADFGPGAAEQLVLQGDKNNTKLLIVEGQGGINHPAYGPVTLSLLYGTAPDALLLVVNPKEQEIDPYGTPILGYRELIATYESLCGTVKPANVVGIALNTYGLTDEVARAQIARARAESGLPADDVVRFGAGELYTAIAPALQKRHPLTARTAL